MVKGFKKCENGHYYSENLDRCPHCEVNEDKVNSFSKNTKFDTDQYGPEDPRKSKGRGHSQMNEAEPDLNKTRPGFGIDIEEDEEDSRKDFDTTHIIPDKDEIEKGFEDKPRELRKLVGWLISYTLDPIGSDFRLFEGRNTIGRNGENNVHFVDPSVSGHHATVLCKRHDFWIKDELSANGTFLNGEEIKPNETRSIKDDDVLKFGNTEMIFKTPLKS